MWFKILALIPYSIFFTMLGFFDYLVYKLWSSWPEQSVGENVINVILFIVLLFLNLVIHGLILGMFYRMLKRKCPECGSLYILPGKHGGTKYSQHGCVSCGHTFWEQHSA